MPGGQPVVQAPRPESTVGSDDGPWLRGLPAVSPCAPGAAEGALQRPLGDPPPAGGAGPGLPAARSRDADQEIEQHTQARDEGVEHHWPLGARSATRLSSLARRTSAPSQRGPNYAGQYEQDGCQGDAEPHGDGLGELVAGEFGF
jgi:hypothetical protein